MRLYDDFIGDTNSNIILKFDAGDLEERFLENLKSQPNDWYYRDIEITYSYNSHGHRCKEIKDVDFDNYILFSGCSHTQGTGLELEKTYPYMLSQLMDCDYYNLAIPGTGPDVVVHNVLNWYYTAPKKPKLVVIQWPDHSRFLSYNPSYKNLIPMGNWNDDEVRRFIVDMEDSGAYFARKKLYTELVSNVLNVPFIKFTYGGQVAYDLDYIKMQKYDVARDLSHSGLISHKTFTDELYKLTLEKLDK